MQNQQPENREHYVDALRGFAAFFVVIAHTAVVGLYKVEPYWTYLNWSPLRVYGLVTKQ